MKSFLFLALFAVSLSACGQSPGPDPGSGASEAVAAPAAAARAEIEAAPGTPAARALDAIRAINPRVQVDSLQAAPIDGYQELIVSGQVVYVSNDGRYLLEGSLYDVEAREDLGQVSLARVRRELLATVPREDRIIFAPENPRHTVTVFTDVECGYCRRLHGEIDEYNRLGIAVEYLAFPRMGLEGADYRKMVSVWCAADRRQAMTDAKSGKRVPVRTCDNPVADQYRLGQRVGLTGTPMIVTSDGTQMPGYVPPAPLRQALDELSAR